MKTIAISAVNLVTGGTLTILQNCLANLSEIAINKNIRVIAIVHKKELCYYPNIEYREYQWPKTSWLKRIWFEYYTLKKISNQIGDVDLWLSLHDITPNVKSKAQAVYCHNAFPFFKYNWIDIKFYKPILLFVYLTNLFYRINIKKNKFVIVQQDIMRNEFIKKFKLEQGRIIVAPPSTENRVPAVVTKEIPITFVYASAGGIQKNFETVCQAAKELENTYGKDSFQVVLTLSGKENAYTKWLYSNWGNTSSIQFKGWISKDELFGYYKIADCLIFASRIESWGLPISEFKQTNKPMILADEPYAYETSAGSMQTAFFSTKSVEELKKLMSEVIERKPTSFHSIPKTKEIQPFAKDWNEIFNLLLN